MDEFITTSEYAAIARIPEATIRYWRYVGTGPKGFKLGRRVLYSRQEVMAWIDRERMAQADDAPRGE